MENNYGLLVNKDAKLHRKYFNEMVKLLGIQVIYRVPNGKNITNQGEYSQLSFSEGIKVGCIFEEHENQKTAKMLGWNSELNENASLIHVPYDLPELQIGCIFEIPSAYEGAPSRLFRVSKLSAKMVYPASVTCELVPEYETVIPPSEINNFVNSDFNLLNGG